MSKYYLNYEASYAGIELEVEADSLTAAEKAANTMIDRIDLSLLLDTYRQCSIDDCTVKVSNISMSREGRLSVEWKE